MKAGNTHVFQKWEQSHGPYDCTDAPNDILSRGRWSISRPDSVEDVQRGGSDVRIDDAYV